MSTLKFARELAQFEEHLSGFLHQRPIAPAEAVFAEQPRVDLAVDPLLLRDGFPPPGRGQADPHDPDDDQHASMT